MSEALKTENGFKTMLHRAYTKNADLSSTLYLVPEQFKVGVTQSDPAFTDTDLDNPVLIDGGYFKDFVSGYPTFDYTNFQVTIRCFLDTSEANGNDIEAIGIFNKDTTPLMQTVVKLSTSESKTTNDEFAFVIKERLIP